MSIISLTDLNRGAVVVMIVW